MATTQDLHRLVDELPESAVPEAAKRLEGLSDELAGLPAVLRDAPEDDEPETPEEREAVRQALEDIHAGRVVSNDELQQELGGELPAVFRDAPIDDEPLTQEEIEAIEEAREDVRAGRVIRNEDLRRELGW